MVSEYTDTERAALPENSQLLVAMWEAEDRGDQAEADRLLSELEGPAHTFMASIPVRHLAGGSRANRLS